LLPSPDTHRALPSFPTRRSSDLREVRPSVVVTHSPLDYMPDHEMTSYLARATAFAAPAPNFLRDRGHGPPLDRIPHLYYADAVEDRKSTRLNSSHRTISYAVFCL